MYSTKGTTWSESSVWKKAQKAVRQHWFIDSYIAAYIQVLYRVTGVHPTGLTVNQGCRQVSTGMLYCSIYFSYDLVAACAKVTQLPSKMYPVHSQLARRMARGGGLHPAVGDEGGVR
jgi:hypothetical protein